MSLEKIIEKEVYGTKSGKQLVSMLSNIFKHKENIENVIVLLKTEENRQKMIKFLEKGETNIDKIHYYVAALRT